MIDRRDFFGMASCFFLGVPSSTVPATTTELFDRVHVDRVIEGFDAEHPVAPWERLGRDKIRYYHFHGAAYEIWWDPFGEEFGLYDPAAKKLYALKNQDKDKELDPLVAHYNELFESITNVGEDTVCYDREVWDGIREAFTKIIAACRR